MAKRFAIIFFITIGTVLFVLTSSVLILFLAPGTEIFGLKYIKLNTHTQNNIKVGNATYHNSANISATFGSSFNGSLAVYADEIQINICFRQQSHYTIEYYDNYSGITDSKIDDPMVNVELQDDGSVRIIVQEYNTIIFQNASSKRFLNINVPINELHVQKNVENAFVFDKIQENGRALAYETDLKIFAKTSLVKFEQDKMSSIIPTFRTLQIETDGKVDTENTQIKCLNYKLTTKNSVEFSASPMIRINALNYDISATGNITFNSKASGNIIAESKYGNVLFVQCVDFTAKTDSGIVAAATKDKTYIRGNANIETGTGNIDINIIEGNGSSKIKTISGDINVAKVRNSQDFEIETRRGFVWVGECAGARIFSGVGNVSVDGASSKLDIKTMRGNIFVGNDVLEINNLTIETTLGSVSAKNVSGEVKIKTAESDAEIKGKAITGTDIDVGGSLIISGVSGRTNISVYESSQILFSATGAISEDVTINAGKSCEELKIYLPGNGIDKTRYVIETASAKAYVANDTEFETFTQRESFSLNNSPSGTNPLLRITAKSTNLKIYFKSR